MYKTKLEEYFFRIKIIFLLLIFVITVAGCGIKGGLPEEKLKMEEYLQEKYGKEFVVESIDYYSEYLGAPKEIKGIAYPKDDKEFKFDIRKFVDGHLWKSRYSNVLYNERYLWLLWSKQAEKPIRKLINDNTFKVEVIFPDEDIESVLRGKTINLSKAKKMFINKLSLNIECALFGDVQEDPQNRLNQLYSLIESCKDNDFNEISLRAVYFNKNYKQNVENQFRSYMNNADPSYVKMKKQGLIIVEYKIKDINNLNSPEEISNYIVKN